MLYSDYPLLIDNVEIKPTRQNWSIEYINILNENMTEDGHSDIEIVRKGKVGISVSMQCADMWASMMTRLNAEASLNVKYYDIASKDYITRSMYMDGLIVKEVPNSDKVQGTNGLYYVSFDLVEF